MDTQYHIIIGRKGKSVDLTIEFKPIDFHHLMGLGKLKDLRIATQNRESVFSGNDIYIFIEEKETAGLFFCRSFFPKEKKDYTLGQPQFTLLFKEKITVSTGEKMVQFDRLTPKDSFAGTSPAEPVWAVSFISDTTSPRSENISRIFSIYIRQVR